jgi:HD superfamily phosphohydrolase YqeK
MGGDDHDKVAFQINQLKNRLSNKTIDELKSYAVTLESYSRNGQPIFGGLHDYINSMSRDAIEKYIVTVCLNKKELLEETKFNSIVKGTQAVFLETTVLQMGGLHDYLYRQPRSTLIRWALTAEAHERNTQGLHILGGLHDYIHTLSDADIAKYIDEKAKKFNDLNSNVKLDALAEKYSINYDETSNFINLLYRKPRSTLINYALTAEAHERKVKGLTLKGGLKDYIHSLSDTEIITKISDRVKLFNELASDKKFEELAKEYQINYDETTNFTFLLYRKDRATLIKYALTAEAHERKVKGLQLMGGLHDYIHTQSDEQIINYITEKVKLFNELAVSKNMDEFSVKYEINYDETTNFTNLLYRKSRSDLIKYALTAEAHERKIKGIQLLGGLHDYIEKLSDEQIINYITEKAKIYKELASDKKFEELANTYSINYVPHQKNEESLKFLQQ